MQVDFDDVINALVEEVAQKVKMIAMLRAQIAVYQRQQFRGSDEDGTVTQLPVDQRQ